ncbi:AraC family transcriptional regulator [Hyalangium gracile]|uniref:AraC family transcriptional regulator n=1 Tax=Hyalangium gracile TaxID=394092 RepID=UPI001CCF0993|nr:AraC family transcriptional regulator [Hyalangium gracile]
MRRGSIAAQAIATVVDAAEEMGISREALLGAIGVTPEALQERDGRLPVAVAMTLFRELERMTGDPTIGLHLTERIRSTAHGVKVYLFRASPTLRSAFERIIRYLPLTNDSQETELEVRGSQAFVRWRVRPPSPPMNPQGSEFYAGSLLRTAREATVAPWRALEVRFSHPPIEPRAERERILGAPVRFGCPHDEFVLPASVLDLPLREPDPFLLEVLQRHANEMLHRMGSRSACDRVRTVLLDLLPEGRATLEETAAELKASPRTLQRELQQEGTSFTRLLDEVKREVAQQFIARSRMEIIEVAFAAGFTELSAFYRAFRRWTGTTPGEYRRQHEPG